MSFQSQRQSLWQLLLVGAVAVLASGCGLNAPAAQQQTPAETPPGYQDTAAYKKDGPYSLCFSNASVSNSWRIAMVEHERYEVQRHPEITAFREADANDDAAKQVSDIDALLAQGCDALIVSPAKLDELKPAIDKAMGQKVPVVLIDRRVTGDNYVAYAAGNNCSMGRLQAEWLVQELGGKGNIVLLSGVKGSSVAEDRMRCAREVFAQHPGINELAQGYANWTPVDGKKIMKAWLTQYQNIDGIWADGSQGVGAVSAYLEAGKPVPPITGCDINLFLKQWKSHGFSAMAVTYSPRVGQTGVLTALDILRGRPVPHNLDVPQDVITTANLDQRVRMDLPDTYWSDSLPEVTKLIFQK